MCILLLCSLFLLLCLACKRHVCCNLMRHVAVCRRVLQCVAYVISRRLPFGRVLHGMRTTYFMVAAVCCSVSQDGALCTLSSFSFSLSCMDGGGEGTFIIPTDGVCVRVCWCECVCVCMFVCVVYICIM